MHTYHVQLLLAFSAHFFSKWKPKKEKALVGRGRECSISCLWPEAYNADRRFLDHCSLTRAQLHTLAVPQGKKTPGIGAL